MMRIRVIRRRVGGTITKDCFIDSSTSLSALDVPTYVLVTDGMEHLHIDFMYSGEREIQETRSISTGRIAFGKITGRLLQLTLNGTDCISDLHELKHITQEMSSIMANRLEAGLQIASEIERIVIHRR